MGIADKIIPHYTYDDWINWEGKWELIEGHPIAMSPPHHSGTSKSSSRIVDADKNNIDVNMLKDAEYSLKEMNTAYVFQLEADCSITPDFSKVFE